MKLTKMGLVCAGLFAVSGCMAAPFGKVYPARMSSELLYRGFSVARPNDSSWYAIPTQESNISMSFWVDKKVSTHTAYATANLLHHNGTIKSHNDFLAFIESTITDRSSRAKLVAHHTKTITRQGQPAVEYEFEWEDYGAAVPGVNVLFAYAKGVAVLHPTLKDAYVDAFYSERGTREEIASRPLAASGEYFLDHVTIYDAPGRKTGQ